MCALLMCDVWCMVFGAANGESMEKLKAEYEASQSETRQTIKQLQDALSQLKLSQGSGPTASPALYVTTRLPLRLCVAPGYGCGCAHLSLVACVAVLCRIVLCWCCVGVVLLLCCCCVVFCCCCVVLCCVVLYSALLCCGSLCVVRAASQPRLSRRTALQLTAPKPID
jgi:hypothetical protein